MDNRSLRGRNMRSRLVHLRHLPRGRGDTISGVDELSTLAELRLPEAEGGEVRIGDLWSDRPVAIAWLRHYA